MPYIEEYRKNNPQYSDLPDDVLADALYQKKYSDLDRGKFMSTFLGKADSTVSFTRDGQQYDVSTKGLDSDAATIDPFLEGNEANKDALLSPVQGVDEPAVVPGEVEQTGRGEDLTSRVARGAVGGAGETLKGFSIIDTLRKRREGISHPLSPQFTEPKEQAIDIRGFRALRGDKAQKELDEIRKIAIETAPGFKEIKNDKLYKAGKKIVDWSNKTFETNPEYDKLFLSKAAQGLGSMAVFAATTFISPVLGALAGAGMNASAQFEDAIRNDASLEEAMRAANIGAAWGLTEVAPIEFAFTRMNKATGGWFSRNITDKLKSKIAKVGVTGLVGAVGEAFQEGMMDFANNWTAKDIIGYDEERDLWQGVDESAEVGGALGFLLTTITSAFGIRRRGKGKVDDVPPYTPPSGTEQLDLEAGGPTEQLPTLAKQVSETDVRDFIKNKPHKEMLANPAYKRFFDSTDLGEDSRPLEEREADAREAYIRLAAKQSKWQKKIADAEAGKPLELQTGMDAALGEREKVDELKVIDEGKTEESPPLLPDGYDPLVTISTNIDSQERVYDIEEAAKTIQKFDSAGSEEVKTTITLNDGTKEQHTITREERDQLSEELDIYLQELESKETLDSPRSKERELRPLKIDEAGLEMVAPNDLIPAPEMFQYKSGVDAEGVSDRLRGIKEFSPESAGILIAWESADGKKYIADGHQRVALLKGLQAQGKNEDQLLRTRIYREGDGYTAQQVRTIASKINIAQGTGTAIDAAKVFRDMDGEALAETMSQLPVNSSLVRNAKGLAKLEEGAFQAVVNDLIEPKYGAMVGEAFEGGEQQAALQILIKAKPASFAEATAMIADIQAGGFVKSEQGGLFGEAEAESLIKQRAEILSSAERNLKKDISIFSGITKNEAQIQRAGENALDTKANEAIVQESKSVMQSALATINTNPELNDGLNKLAKRYRSGEITRKQAAEQFISAAKEYSSSRRNELAAEPGNQGSRKAGARGERVESEKAVVEAGKEPVKPPTEKPTEKIELTGEPSAEQKLADEQRVRDKKRQGKEDVPAEEGAGELFGAKKSPDMFPGTSLTGEQGAKQVKPAVETKVLPDEETKLSVRETAPTGALNEKQKALIEGHGTGGPEFIPPKKGEAGLSLARERTSGLSVEQAQGAVRKALGHKLSQRVRYYETLSDIPDDVIGLGRQLLSDAGIVEGFVKGRNVYLITKNISSNERAAWVAWHEMWHRGAKIRYGQQFDRVLVKARTNNIVRRVGDEINKQRRLKLSETQRTDEALAELHAAMRTKDFSQIERQYSVKVPSSMKSGWRAAVRRWIDAIKRVMKITTDTDLTDLQVSGLVRGVDLDTAGKADESPLSVAPREDVKFEREEVEKGWQESNREMHQKTALESFKEHWQRIKEGWTRHYINLPTTPKFADVTEQLRKLEAAPSVSMEKTVFMIKSITQDMTKEDIDLFTRKIVLDDLSYEITVDHDLPWGLAPEEVTGTLERIDAVLQHRPDILEAVEARRIMVRSVARQMVDFGLYSEEQILNPYYYRHQILDYMNAQNMFGPGGRKLKKPRANERKGSIKSINVNYLAAEFEWLNKAFIDMAHMNTFTWVKDSDHNYRDDAIKAAKEANQNMLDAVLKSDLDTNGRDVVNKKGKATRRTSPLNEKQTEFKQRIAMATAEISGEIKGMEVPAAYKKSAQIIIDGTNESDPDFWQFINYLLKNGKEGSVGARMLFSAVAQRKVWKRGLLGKKYIDTRDMRELVKAGFAREGDVAWQIDKGKILFTAQTISESVIDRLLIDSVNEQMGLTPEEVGQIKDSLRRVLAVGGEKYQMVIPAELARTLESMHDEQMLDMSNNMFAFVQRQWKRWMLVSPRRVIKYNLNNASGDFDATIAIAPKVIKKFFPAMSELFGVMYRGERPSARFSEATRRDVFGSGFSRSEIMSIGSDRDAFKFLQKRGLDFSNDEAAKESLKRVAKSPVTFSLWAWKHMQKSTWFRENILRYAAYLHFVEITESGRQLTPLEYGATRPEILDSILDPKDKAAMMARKTLGDYGDISHFGMRTRRYAIPFWSWSEVNFTRYAQLIKNASDQSFMAGVGKGTLVGALAAKRATVWLTLRTMAVYSLLTLYNTLRYGDEEDELPVRERLRLHINLGRNEAGEVSTLRFQGSLSDFLEWFGVSDAVDVLSEVESGRASYADVMKAIAKAPFNKIIAGLTPVFKTPIEMATGQQWWPDVFRPRRIRDKWRYAARVVSFENEYDLIFGKPSRGYLKSWQQAVITRRDLGEMAYNRMRSAGFGWLEKETGKAGYASSRSKKSSAIYEMMIAKKYGDKKAYYKARRKVFEYVRTRSEMKKAIDSYRKNSAPLAMLNKKQYRAFLYTLTPEERKRLVRAEIWQRKTFR